MAILDLTWKAQLETKMRSPLQCQAISRLSTPEITPNFILHVILKPKMSTLFSTVIEFIKKTSISNLCYTFYNKLYLTLIYDMV